MPDCTFEYAVIRVVPRVERGEFLNVGVLLYCLSHDFLRARIEVDWNRLQLLAPQLDVQMTDEYLKLIPLISNGGQDSGPIGQMPQRARFQAGRRALVWWVPLPRTAEPRPQGRLRLRHPIGCPAG